MSTFDDNERSTSQNRPVDLYTFTTPTVTYHLTSYPLNVAFGGNTFLATPMSRGEQQVTQDATGRELLVYLPTTHPLVQRYTASGIPENGVTVTLQRLQTVSGVAQQQFTGFATGIAVQGHVATIRCPSVTDDALKIRLPVIQAQSVCNHVLFDNMCAPNPGTDGPVRGSFTMSSTTTSQTISPGLVTFVVAGIGGHPDNYFQYGRLIHFVTGQTSLILQQVGASLTLVTPIVGVQPGDSVFIEAGCDHGIATCNAKFANFNNFGGMPNMTTTWAPWRAGQGLSAIQQP